jgi:hypothetical protein
MTVAGGHRRQMTPPLPVAYRHDGAASFSFIYGNIWIHRSATEPMIGRNGLLTGESYRHLTGFLIICDNDNIDMD